MSVITVIAKAVDAKTITRDLDKGLFPKTFQIDGDLAANTIPVYLVGIDGTYTTVAYDDGGGALSFSATKTSISIFAPCTIAIVKGITANAVGLRLVELG